VLSTEDKKFVRASSADVYRILKLLRGPLLRAQSEQDRQAYGVSGTDERKLLLNRLLELLSEVGRSSEMGMKAFVEDEKPFWQYAHRLCNKKGFSSFQDVKAHAFKLMDA
jgi:hypothetical protein